MDSVLSYLTSSSKVEDDAVAECSDEGNEDICIKDAAIAPQILTEILIRIDDHYTIGFVCPLVCRRWYSILSATGFWISYMQYRSLNLPPVSIRSALSLDMKKVCLKQPFERNLINNPSGEIGYSGWTIRDSGGDGFNIEQPPVGCAQCSDGDITSAFVTSYSWCTKYYVVDLWKEGIEPAFLDEYCPPITVSEYYTCRFDCASTYSLDVALIPNGKESYTSTVGSVPIGSDRFGRTLRMRRHQLRQEVTSNVLISRLRTMEQWEEAEWQKLEHTFVDYPQGIRYVVFNHGGKDNQFWAGYYGAKMARASVVVHYCDRQRRRIL